MDLSPGGTATAERDLEPTPALDGLRGVAILAVLATHLAFLDDGSYRFALRGGYLGVDVFIVLSAFLIGSVLLRSLESGSFSTGSFAWRRLRRLWPALGVFLVVETPVRLTDAQKDLLRQLDASLTDPKHNPKTRGWMDRVKEFFQP